MLVCLSLMTAVMRSAVSPSRIRTEPFACSAKSVKVADNVLPPICVSKVCCFIHCFLTLSFSGFRFEQRFKTCLPERLPSLSNAHKCTQGEQICKKEKTQPRRLGTSLSLPRSQRPADTGLCSEQLLDIGDSLRHSSGRLRRL